MADDIDRAEAAADAEIQAIFNSSQQFAVKGDGTVKVGAKSNGGMKAAGGGGSTSGGSIIANYGTTNVPVDIEQALNLGTLPLGANRPLTIEELKFIEYIYYPLAHGSTRHAGRSKAFLKNRAIKEGKDYTSSFFSDTQYTETVNEAIDQNRQAIEAWLQDPTQATNKAFNYHKTDGDLGWVYDKNNDRYFKNSKAIVVFKKNGNGGFYILTSYVSEVI